MGLVLQVGAASDVFRGDFAREVAATLEAHFGFPLTPNADNEAILSEELSWSWWKKLQASARALLGETAVPHLLAMPAWHGVYLPVETEIGSFSFHKYRLTIDVASGYHLCAELIRYGKLRSLPYDQEGLRATMHTYYDVSRVDDDPEVQMYTSLLERRIG